MSRQCVVVITGAGRGIGNALVHKYSSMPNTFVIGGVREKAPEKPTKLGEGSRVEFVENLELTSEKEIESFVDVVTKFVESQEISGFTLINNAGVLHGDSIDKVLRYDQLEETFRVNTIAPLLLTSCMLHLLRKAPKGKACIVNMSSVLGSIHDNPDTLEKHPGCYGYRASKAALNSITACLAHDLKNDEIAVYSVHPGYVSTELNDCEGEISKEESASRLTNVLEKLSFAQTGKFFANDGREIAW